MIALLFFYSMIRKYDFFKKIESDEPLAQLFNKVMDDADFLRASTTPTIGRGLEDECVSSFYYLVCCWEVYCHQSFATIKHWISTIDEYEKEFGFSWKYYAASKRIESVRENCILQDGERAEDIANEFDLKEYSIVDELYCLYDYSILDNIKEHHFDALKACSSINPMKGFEKIVGNIPLYKEEEGEMKKMSFAEKEMYYASKLADKEIRFKYFISIYRMFTAIASFITILDKEDDNKDALINIRDKSIKMMKLEIEL